MIHAIKKPERAYPLLKDIVDLQVTLLEIVADLLPAPLTDREAFIITNAPRFVLGTRTKEDAEEAIRWLTEIRKGCLWEALSNFANNDKLSKQTLVEKIKRDIQLLEDPVERVFEFAFKKDPTKLY